MRECNIGAFPCVAFRAPYRTLFDASKRAVDRALWAHSGFEHRFCLALGAPAAAIEDHR
jgi:hypothetical protein